jgi:hypothetical protein
MPPSYRQPLSIMQPSLPNIQPRIRGRILLLALLQFLIKDSQIIFIGIWMMLRKTGASTKRNQCRQREYVFFTGHDVELLRAERTWQIDSCFCLLSDVYTPIMPLLYTITSNMNFVDATHLSLRANTLLPSVCQRHLNPHQNNQQDQPLSIIFHVYNNQEALDMQTEKWLEWKDIAKLEVVFY